MLLPGQLRRRQDYDALFHERVPSLGDGESDGVQYIADLERNAHSVGV